VNGRTPLSYAAEDGHEAVVLLLVEQEDVKADSKGVNGRTPLSYAAEVGHEAVVRLLAERDDVEADSKAIDGATPLWYAAVGGHEAVAKLLLASDGVDPGLQRQIRTDTSVVCGKEWARGGGKATAHYAWGRSCLRISYGP